MELHKCWQTLENPLLDFDSTGRIGPWNICIYRMALHGVWSFEMGNIAEFFTQE